MITEILRRTYKLRPTDGLHDPSGISVAPVTPLHPPLPPGLFPATPAITTHKPKKERTGITKQPQAPIKVKLPFENASMVLQLRDAAIAAKVRDGVSMERAKAFGDRIAVGQSKQYLKEKSRLKVPEGPVIDMLVKRQRSMARVSGVPEHLIP